LSRLLFLSLPVNDLAASRRFFEQLGFEFNQRFCDEGAVCMVVSDQAFVMLLQRECFAGFVTRPVADARVATAMTVAIGAESREAVDAFAESALAAGATPGKDLLDFGFMYQRSFHDLDGHFWEVIWMDRPAAGSGDQPTSSPS